MSDRMSTGLLFVLSGALGVAPAAAGGGFVFDTSTTIVLDHELEQSASAAGDLNEDGVDDIVIGSQPLLTVLFGDGEGGFITQTYGPGGGRAVVDDFTGDGHADVAVASTEAFLTYAGDGKGGLTPIATLPYDLAFLVHDFVSADVDGDGIPDAIATVTNNFLLNVLVLRNTGSGAFAIHDELESPEHPFDIAPGDFDGDGDIDFALSANVGEIPVYSNLGDGHFEYHGSIPFPGEVCWGLAACDLDLDGDMDLAATTGVSGGGDNVFRFLASNGDLTWTERQVTSIDGGIPGLWHVTTADLSGTGRPDVVICDLVDSRAFLLANLEIDGETVLAVTTMLLLDSLPFHAVGARRRR